MAKSTGPRTPRGKARSSQNAARHWIESARILPDEQREAAILRSGFADEFHPHGALENELIDDLTFNRLIKRRIDIAYTREFSKACNEKATEMIENIERSASQFYLRAANLGHKGWDGRALGERLRPDLCIDYLEALKNRIGNRGILPGDLAELRLYYGEHITEWAARVMYELVAAQNPAADKKEAVKEVLTTLEAEIQNQNQRKDIVEGILEFEAKSEIQEPERAALETLSRYRAGNGRELKDILDCLERVRRLKTGA